jgi:hypothetical protein
MIKLQKKTCFFVFFFIAALCCSGASVDGDSLFKNKAAGFVLAPEFHINEDLHLFFLQKSHEFKERYFIEWTSGAELAFFSVNNRLFFFVEMALTVGLGRWFDKPILFDPREVDAGFGPQLEYRFSTVNIALGLDHHCFHEIDTLNLTPVYWNRLCLNAASKNFRPGDFTRSANTATPLTWKNRMAWQASLGYYFHEVFGMDTSIVSWNNDHDIDVIAEMRCIAYRFNGFAGVVSAKTGAYLTKTRGVLWKQEAGAEVMSIQGKFGFTIFANWVIVDQLQVRLNKDQLLLVGIKAFF